jgi:hypothetical protein
MCFGSGSVPRHASVFSFQCSVFSWRKGEFRIEFWIGECARAGVSVQFSVFSVQLAEGGAFIEFWIGECARARVRFQLSAKRTLKN